MRVVRRDNSEKFQAKWTELSQMIPKLLEQIHEDMYERARKERDDHIKEANTWADFMNGLNQKNLVLTPWCNEAECEKAANVKSKEESLEMMAKAQD